METLIKRYFDYLKEITDVEFIEETGYYLVYFPLPNRYDEFTSIYLKTDKDNIIITDGGDSIREIQMLGIDIFNNHRTKLLNKTLKSRGMKLDKDTNEILTITDIENFYYDFNMYLRGISNIQDFYLTKRENALRIFADEFKEYIGTYSSNETFSLEDNISFTGKSNAKLTFNYKLTSQKTNKSTFIKLQSSSDDVYKNIFLWDDLKDEEKNDNSFLVVINDKGKVSEQKHQEIQQIYKSRNIDSIDWSDKETILLLLLQTLTYLYKSYYINIEISILFLITSTNLIKSY